MGVVLGAELSSIRDLLREELSLHALLVMGEQLLMEMQIERSLKVVVNFFVGRSVYKRVQSKRYFNANGVNVKVFLGLSSYVTGSGI